MKFVSIFKVFFTCLFIFLCAIVEAQLNVIETNNAQILAQRLVGDGVVISNAQITQSASEPPSGLFTNLNALTKIGIDSGIVITNGRAKSNFQIHRFGVDNNGSSNATSTLADNALGLPGDQDLADLLHVNVVNLHDAVALEFDFIPLGDNINFRYVMSSEEYSPSTVCVFNDAFAFFISGPGIVGKENIALLSDNTFVTITNVNDIKTAACINHPEDYVDNSNNKFFTHNGHTTVLTASSKVQPCQTYHLKLVIADMGDFAWDTGVFLEAKSLTSNVIKLGGDTKIDVNQNLYLVEGCQPGSFEIRRPVKESVPLNISLSYGGNAQNGIDVQTLPLSATIPAGDSIVKVDLIPIVDNIPEGIEKLIVYAAAGGCTTGLPTDSIIVQLRDYDTLTVSPQQAGICSHTAVQLLAASGYSSYKWDADPALNNESIYNPIVLPTVPSSTFYCTSTTGTCNARDSSVVKWKKTQLTSKKDINCRNDHTGQIRVGTVAEWVAPISFSLDKINWQTDSNFYNLAAGNYRVYVRDAVCMDSVDATLIQLFPSLVISGTTQTSASCSGASDGSVTITATGGQAPYLYSGDGVNFQSLSTLNLSGDLHTVSVKDENGCEDLYDVVIPLNNTVTIDASDDAIICEGSSYTIPATSNGSSFAWTPNGTLQNSSSLSPIATPVTSTKYYLTATTGICTRIDSITIALRPAPSGNAGSNAVICTGKTVQLNATGGVSYQWSPNTFFTTASNISDPVVKPLHDITYSVMVKDVFGCESLFPWSVNVHVTDAIKLSAGNDTVAIAGQPMQLHVTELSNTGITHYSWSPANFLDNAGSKTPIAVLQQDQRYVITGVTADGCEGTTSILIKVYKGPDIYIPSAFTPNKDGLNDVLKALPVGIKDFHFFTIFNRWGQMIYSTRISSQGWDGTMNGLAQPAGTYVWITEGIDYKGNTITHKGLVTIIR